MGIILKGDKETEKTTRVALEKICKVTDRRAFGYLLYELAGLPNREAMEARLSEIAARRKTISEVRGMKAEEPNIDAAGLMKKVADKIMELESNYAADTDERKNLFSANAWQPSHQQQAASTYFRHLLRKFAAECIAEAGGQK